MSVEIRTAVREDAEAIRGVYEPYVVGTAITFDYETPSQEAFGSRIVSTLRRFPFLVAEEEGRILGYAYAAAFKDRAAYERSVELSVYLDMDERGRGVGSMLYESMETILARQGVLNLNACIALASTPDEFLDRASMRFHEARGFRLVGTFHSCGFKFGRWYDMVWMEKMLGEHSEAPAPFIPFEELQGR